MTAPIDRVLDALRSAGSNPKQSNVKSWQSRCPVPTHGRGRGDKNPSLSISEGHFGRVLVHCFAGCSDRDVFASLGLRDRPAPWPPANQTHRPPRQPHIGVRWEGPRLPPESLAAVAEQHQRALLTSGLTFLSKDLGVTAASLLSLGIGWDATNRAWSFPMRNGAGAIVGFRLRRPDGRKFTVRGTHEGIFLPIGLRSREQLFVAEGPTDTAALLDKDINAVGRPSCHGGMSQILDLLRLCAIRDVVIVADRDRPGQQGAERLASAVLRYATLRIVTPPAGDVREWCTSGRATRDDILHLVDRAPVRRLCARVVDSTWRWAS